MVEVELKLQVPPARARAVDSAVAGPRPAPRQRLQAHYHDTADEALAQARLALRVRREGRRWVQTLKGAGEDSLVRPEQNIARPGSAAQPPVPDPALHAGTPTGERLLALLADGAALQTRFATDVLRRVRRVGRGAARLELCFDRGQVRAGDDSLPLCELEIELVAGAPQALIEEAWRWVQQHGLWLDTRSKAERGSLLARGERVAPARTAVAAALEPALSFDAAWRCVLRACSAQVVANASQIACGDHGPEHVHQMRVGLRRLRSAMALFSPRGDAAPPFDAALSEAAADCFRRLGAVRDRDVLTGTLAAEVAAARAAVGLPEGPLPHIAAAAGTSACAIVRDAPTQRLLLDLIAAGLEPAGGTPSPDVAPLRDQLAAALARWHRRAARDARGWEALDDDGRHRLRKRVKRLRYAVEFCAPLFGAAAVRRYLKPLRRLQDRLGELNDVAVALQAFAAASDDPGAAFALGWLAARREALLGQIAPELDDFAKARRFWR